MQRFRKHSQPARLLVGRRPDSFVSHNASCSWVALVSNGQPLPARFLQPADFGGRLHGRLSA